MFAGSLVTSAVRDSVPCCVGVGITVTRSILSQSTMGPHWMRKVPRVRRRTSSGPVAWLPSFCLRRGTETLQARHRVHGPSYGSPRLRLDVHEFAYGGAFIGWFDALVKFPSVPGLCFGQMVASGSNCIFNPLVVGVASVVHVDLSTLSL